MLTPRVVVVVLVPAMVGIYNIKHVLFIACTPLSLLIKNHDVDVQMRMSQTISSLVCCYYAHAVDCIWLPMQLHTS
jgi:heme/copper-type cytochrome/quinol oxidase subunit 3